jgi:hypothetical protein
MSRIRGSGMLTTVVTVLMMAMAALVMSPTTASASPKRPYPPPPPSLTVDRGVVKYGTTVNARGNKFSSRERVYVTVTFKAKNSRHWRVVKTTSVRADRNGRFSVYIRTSRAGQVTITARGSNSRKSASAYVYVLDKRRGHGGGGWSARPASFSTSLAAAPAPAPAQDGALLTVAGLGLLAAAGSVVVTHVTVRRRRRG